MQQAIINYVNAKRDLTICMQDKFKQLCNRCNKYTGCGVYGAYVNAWIELQKHAIIGEEDEK